MAPELALRQTRQLRPHSTVLDPMVGSGTTLRCAADNGHRGVGFDVDPLAVLMTRVWTTPLDVTELRRVGADALVDATSASASQLGVLASDGQTSDFVEYWFGPEQRADLLRLAAVLRPISGPVGDALRLALSRIIITKDRGASLARDVSHSRPHKVEEESNYDVGRGFARAVEQLGRRLERNPPRGGVDVELGDARELPLTDSSVDAVITSPPYLNAIDYLRGHRMALVWLGFALDHLREVRGTSIGTERGISSDADRALAERLAERMGDLETLQEKHVRMILRYVLDMLGVMKETARVLRDDGVATIVIGNSSIRGTFVANDAAIVACAREAGLRLTGRRERPLPAAKRYLPPPGQDSGPQLERRMRTEVVLKFRPS
jgi:hypothetical protein